MSNGAEDQRTDKKGPAMSRITDNEEEAVLKVTFDEFAEIFELAQPRLERFPYPRHDLTFSCSRSGIWPSTRQGYVQPTERTLITGRSRTLDIVAAILIGWHDPRGGRFTIDLEAARVASTRQLICRLEVVA